MFRIDDRVAYERSVGAAESLLIRRDLRALPGLPLGGRQAWDGEGFGQADIAAGGVLILVRRRRALFEAIVRALIAWTAGPRLDEIASAVLEAARA